MSLPLKDTGVLVTRPAGQADALCRAIGEAGGRAFHIPAMVIRPVADQGALHARAHVLGQCDIAIFVSVNAVDYSKRLFPDVLAVSLKDKAVAAIGSKTASRLADLGIAVSVVPASRRFDSEGLLAHPALQQVQGKRVLIIRGVGGREMLADTLGQRGAHIDYLEVYRRLRPAGDQAELKQLLQQGRIQAVVTTSNEILQNLYDMLGTQERSTLLQLPLVVMSRRGAELARQLGFTSEAVVAKESTTDALLKAIVHSTSR
jgi:uroporphyrinogen-III synthase